MRERRHDIDALRVLAVVVLLFYHASRPFDTEPWHVKNAETSLALEVAGDVVTPWRLPLLFMISGAGTFFALGVRSSARYLGERVWRLGLPLAVGMLVVVPPQVYVERIGTWMPNRQSPMDFHGSYLEFYRHAFTGVYPAGNLSWHHLWFLAYLLVFSVAALPLFVALRRRRGQAALDRLAGLFAWRGSVFLLALPLFLVHVTLRGHYPSTHALVGDWWNLAHYFLLFVLGYVLVGDRRFRDVCARERGIALALFALVVPLWVAVLTAGTAPVPYSAGYAARMALRTAVEWLGLVAVLGYARHHLDRASPWLARAGEMVYPFYVWHQTVIVVLAFFVVQWSAGLGVKFVALSATSLAGTLLMCEVLRRTTVTRVLFGMKPR